MLHIAFVNSTIGVTLPQRTPLRLFHWHQLYFQRSSMQNLALSLDRELPVE